MKYIKTYEANYGRYDKLKSYEKEWILNDGTPRSRYWLISNFKTLVEFSKLCTKESRRCILPVIDDIMRKLTDEEKRLKGTLRSSKTGKKGVVVPIDDGLRIPPARLNSEAAELWVKDALPLIEAEILTNADVGMFTDLCQLEAEYRGLMSEIRGQYIQIGDEGQIIRHPGWSICRDMLGLINGMRRDFGLSPLSREKLPARPKEQLKENPFARFG